MALCGFTLLTTLSAQTDFPAKNEWMAKWENSRQYTLEALALIPDSSLSYRPSLEQMTVREQFQHLAGNVYMLSTRFLAYAPDNYDKGVVQAQLRNDTLDGEALAAAVNAAYDFGAAAVQQLSAEGWEEMAENFFVGPRPRRVIVYLLQDHATHHRAQVLVYLRTLGLKPPRYRGW